MEDNDKNLNKNPQEMPSEDNQLSQETSELSSEDRKLGRAPLSVSEEDSADVSGEVSEGIEIKPVESTMEDYFLRYSMSVIVDRALPDVRDG